MSWICFNDNRWSDPKILEVGLAASGLDANAICYTASHSTEGFIPTNALRLLAGGEDFIPLVEKLVHAELWITDDDGDGYWISDFQDYQLSDDEVRHIEEEIESGIESTIKLEQGWDREVEGWLKDQGT